MKKIKYIIITLGIMIFMHSCDLTGSVDEIKPFYKLTEENLFTDAEKTESVLSGVYTGWRQNRLSRLTSFNGTLLSGNYTGDEALETNNVSPDHSYVEGYGEYYGLIQRANYLIKALQSEQEIPGLTAIRRLEIEAEARLQRAMGHFFLLRSFGQFYDLNSQYGIVIRSTPVSGNEDMPRATVQQAYDQIISDLDYAMINAPATADAGRLTKYAAKAFKAKVLLYTEDWNGAASLALEVINSGVYELKSDFRDLYAEGYKSKEVIFSPISIYPNLEVYLARFESPGLLLKQAADKGHDDGDPLTDIDSDGDLVTGKGFDPRFAYAHATSTLPSGVYNNKYVFPLRAPGQQNSLFILRLGELYLIYAEARARVGSGVDTDALARLNAIRQRAGLSDAAPATKAELLEAIRLEKNLELFAEIGEPWFDMVRYHILGDINISDIKSTITNNNQLILPIPTLALSGNGGLVQNPGY